MSTHSAEDLRQAFLAHRREHGQAATLRVIKDMTGGENLDNVTEDQRDELINALTGETSGPPAEFSNADGTVNAVAVYAKWNAMARGRGRARGK